MYSTVSISKHDGASHRDLFFSIRDGTIIFKREEKKYLPLSVFTVTS